MKKTILLTALLFIIYNVSAQSVSVPYRIGDKFGVADSKGKMIIPAEYDIVEPQDYNDTKYFIAYKLNGLLPLSSLIYNNKVILADKAYKHYYINNGLINAIQYVNKRSRDRSHTEIEHLYDLKGKLLLQGDYSSIAIRDDIDEKKSINEILIYATDVKGGEFLYLYDKKLKKITRTFIDNAKSLDLNFNFDTNYRDRSITHIYLDNKGAGRKLILKLENSKIIVALDEPVNFRAEKQRIEDEERNWLGSPAVEMPYDKKPDIPVNSDEEKIILKAREIKEKRGFYYLPKKIEEIVIENKILKKDEIYIVSKNNKQGLYSVYTKSFVIPVMYDEILWGEFPGHYGGNILRNGSKYGMIIYAHKDNKIIEPIFDKIPLLVDRDYFGEKAGLIKLYDEAGKLFCYADEKGKLFYKP
jgi:hypothetical protein